MAKKYFLGLDCGSDSIGYCVTDENYNIIRKKRRVIDGDKTTYYGQHVWGSRLFEEAKDASTRRQNRESRRRLQRRRWRIVLLQECFKEEMNKVDPYFFDRLNNSAIHLEDRKEELRAPHLLFNEVGYTDKEYYKKYPTIYHLRKALISENRKFDLREIYIALAHMIKYRGNFLLEGDIISTESNIKSLLEHFNAIDEHIEDMNNGLDTDIPQEMFHCTEEQAVKAMECFKKEAKKGSLYDGLVNAFQLTASNKKTDMRLQIFRLIAGSEIKVGDLFFNRIEDEELAKEKILFADEEKFPALLDKLDDEKKDIILETKALRDLCVLTRLLKGKQYVSDSMIEIYNNHKVQLKELKRLVKKYHKDQYFNFFRNAKDPERKNYVNYVGVNNINNKAIRCSHKTSKEELYKEIKTMFQLDKLDKQDFGYEPADLESLKKIRDSIEAGEYLLRQNARENGVLPYQLNKVEMNAIIENQGKYYPFLLEKAPDFINPHEESYKIISILEFKIPYFVGPLSDKETTKNNWVVKAQKGVKITPWNFHEVIDEDQTAEMFIENLKNYCTYLIDEPTLPKKSLRYSMYEVLNEMNNWCINDNPITEQDKLYLLNNLYFTNKSPKLTDIKQALANKYNVKAKDILLQQKSSEKKEVNAEDIHANLSSYVDMLKSEAFGKKLLSDMEVFEKAEEIIYAITIFEDKKVLQRKLKKMGLDSEHVKYFCKLKYKDWGRLSKKLLDGITDQEETPTGEKYDATILSIMLKKPLNFMEIYATKKKYHFAEKVEEIIRKDTDTIEDRIDKEYVNPTMKRTLRQAIRLIQELKKVLGIEHFDRYFIETTRTKEESKRTSSRKKLLLEAYSSAQSFIKDKAEANRISMLKEKLDEQTDARLQSKKIFLYFMQLGRDVYSGKEIDIDDILTSSGDSKYDIDHIIPQSKVKDDSFLNTVLVSQKANRDKTDTYPIPETILTKEGRDWIKKLNSIKMKNNTSLFMPNEKMKKLLRSTRDQLRPEEIAGFINRQLVSTNQSVKAICSLIRDIDKDATVVYSKANLVSDFRHEFNLIKSRDINNFHHAHDAYLNIVVGNTYNRLFSAGNNKDIDDKLENRIKEKLDNREILYVDVHHLFTYQDLYLANKICTGQRIWKVKRYERDAEDKRIQDEDGRYVEISSSEGTIDLVRKNLSYNDVLTTRMLKTSVGKSGLFNKISIHKNDGTASFPLKAKGIFASDSYQTKYGGYSDLSNPYSMLVKSEITKGKGKGKAQYSIEFVPQIVLLSYKNKDGSLDLEKVKEYLVQNKQLKNPEIICEKLLKNTILEFPYTSTNGELGKVRLAITGISSHGLACINQTEPIFDQKHTAIVKKISTILGTNAPAGKKIDLTQYENVTGDLKKNKLTITREETADLFDYITTKIYTKPAFEGIPSIGGILLKLHDFLEAFKVIPTTITQLHILSTMIALIQSKSVQGNSLRVLDQSLPNSIGAIQPSNVLKPGTKIIQTSISGFYEKVLFTVPEE